MEMFDSTIGGGTILMPFGGKYQLTPTEGSIHKIPLLEGTTDTASIITWGYNPLITKWSPYHGGAYAVIESLAKIVAMGGDYNGVRLSFQEYFETLGDNPTKWGKPYPAL
jgi:phosphoribosylformylglycinamidine synthase